MKNVRVMLMALFLVVFGTGSFAMDEVRVLVDDEELTFDVSPQIIDGRTMLPLRAVFEAIGVTVDYNSATRGIIASDGEKTVCLTVGSNVMTINGEAKELDVPAKLVNNRTLVPLRACAESFDMIVNWDEETRIVDIKTEVYDTEKNEQKWLSKTEYKYDENENKQCVNISRPGVTYDENGNMIYKEYSDGSWEKYTYDENGNIIYEEDSDGDWIKYEYDDNGNEVYWENSNGYWAKYEYDENNHEIYREYSRGLRVKHEYDEKGNLVYEDLVSGVEDFLKHEYDEKGNFVYREYTPGYFWKYEYDKNGNVIYKECSSGIWEKNTYDEENRLIYQKRCIESNESWKKYIYDEDMVYMEDSEGNTSKYEFKGNYYAGRDFIKYEYDDNGNLLYEIDAEGCFTKYDGNGNILYSIEDGCLRKYEYDENGNVVYKEDSDGNWYKYEYDEHNNRVNYENSYGEKEICNIIYDENGNVICEKYSDGCCFKYKYDELNRKIYEETNNHHCWDHYRFYNWCKTEYDNNGNVVKYYDVADVSYGDNTVCMDYTETNPGGLHSCGYNKKYEYNEEGNIVRSEEWWYNGWRNGDCTQYSIFDYDENGNILKEVVYEGEFIEELVGDKIKSSTKVGEFVEELDKYC